MHRFAGGQRDQAALGAPAHGTGVVGEGGGARAAGQDEILERWQRFVEAIEFAFEPADALGMHHVRAGNADLAAEVEQVVLHVDQQRAHVVGQFLAEDETDQRVGFVDVAQRLDTQAVLGDALAIAEAGGAGVAGAGVDLGKAVTHLVLLAAGETADYTQPPDAKLTRHRAVLNMHCCPGCTAGAGIRPAPRALFIRLLLFLAVFHEIR